MRNTRCLSLAARHKLAWLRLVRLLYSRKSVRCWRNKRLSRQQDVASGLRTAGPERVSSDAQVVILSLSLLPSIESVEPVFKGDAAAVIPGSDLDPRYADTAVRSLPA